MELITATASEDFKKNLLNGIRYVDKTALLVPILRGDHETTFFLRPRRFGKTLTLSMIRYFVEDTRDEALNAENRELFKGLKIMEAGESYTRQMTTYPVIHLTFQTVKGPQFEDAWELLKKLIGKEYDENSFLLESGVLSEKEIDYFLRVQNGFDRRGEKATRADYVSALKQLSEFLRRESGYKTVVLIDEYDVPLEKAYQNGYYRQMVDLIGPLLQSVLKTNTANLQFAVITGCLRIAKEGIYAGLNNPEVNTVLSANLGDAIGFTDAEVRKLLSDSGFPDRYEEVRKWYDGYNFGKTVIYNPWSVIKHIETLTADPERPPMPYWANTSGNAIIREMAEHADEDTREKIERVMQGETIDFPLRDTIVYNELYDKPENVLNVLLSAGYLTAESFDGKAIYARIPNKEVHQIFEDQISDWFRDTLHTFDVGSLYKGLETGNTELIEDILNEKFLSAMSYFDTAEAFYHGILLALLQQNRRYVCTSNRESGDGRFDLSVKQRTRWDQAFVLEVKVSDSPTQLLKDSKTALTQIEANAYVTELLREGYKTIQTFGLAFCKKRCRVAKGKTFEGTNAD